MVEKLKLNSKEITIKVSRRLVQDATWEDILERIYFVAAGFKSFLKEKGLSMRR